MKSIPGITKSFSIRPRKSIPLHIVSGVAGLLVSALALAAPAAIAPKSQSDQAYQTWGYQPWWMHANWPAIDLGLWRRVILFELPITAEGAISGKESLPPDWEDMAGQASRCGTAFDLAFTLFDETIFEQVFSSATRRETLLRQMLELHGQAGASGIHLDVEIYQNVSANAVKGYREFVKRLSRELRRKDARQLLSIFGVVGAKQELLDASTISAVHNIVVQGYDAHWRDSPVAGSVAPLKGGHKLSWENSLKYYLALGVPRSKLLFSVPYYGYEWPVENAQPGSATTGSGKDMTYAPLPVEWVPKIQLSALEQGRAHGARRDPETGSSFYTYQDAQGNWWQGWYEDEASIARKMAFVEQEKLAGIAVFTLGYDAGHFDALLTSAWGKRPACYALPAKSQP